MLGFPCNQFGAQEPGTEAEIKEFVSSKFGVTFPMFAKIDVNGGGAHPLFKWLKDMQSGTLGDFIKWNFTKFLVNRTGRPVARYAPGEPPFGFEDAIVRELGTPSLLPPAATEGSSPSDTAA